MNKKIIFLLVPLVFSPFTSQPANAQSVVAKINSKEILTKDFNRIYSDSSKFFSFNPPSKQAVLEDLIKRELGIQEAKRLGLQNDQAVIDRMNTVLYEALIERALGDEIKKIEVSDKEAEAYYKRYPELRTSHIFVSVPPNPSKDQEKDALDKIKNIRDKYLSDKEMTFAEVAQRFSEGIAAPMGGDIDYQTKDKLDPEYYKTALELKKPGSISKIIRTRYGYHIVKLTALRPWAEVDKIKIKRLVFEERRQALFENYMKGLRKKANVVVNAKLLDG